MGPSHRVPPVRNQALAAIRSRAQTSTNVSEALHALRNQTTELVSESQRQEMYRIAMQEKVASLTREVGELKMRLATKDPPPAQVQAEASVEDDSAAGVERLNTEEL